MVLADLVDELVLGHGLCGVVDVPALGAEGLDGLLADVLEQEETKILLQALKQTLQENRENMDLLRPLAESLKCLMDAGMDIAA